jgi:glycosyltransferase involved in cell wall biosynthesis
MGPVNRQELVRLRNEQIKLTTTPWFMLLDGDEIWPEPNIIQLIKAIKTAKPTTIALVNRTRNCLGDIYHYQPESKGQYHIGPWQGHLNIRAIRKIPGLKVEGQYPLESYTHQGISLQEQPDKLELVNTWYLHTTHLQRSDWQHQGN